MVLLAGRLLGESIGIKNWASILVGFSGVLLIARPGGTLNSEDIMSMLTAAACLAVYLVQTRQLAGKEHQETMLFY